MLPKNTLGRQMLSKLKVCRTRAPHQAQKPVSFEITQVSQQAGAAKAGN
jgi:large subunit ribosomal protein L13